MGRGSYFWNERPEVQQLVPTGAIRILDVGCAAGRFGAALKEGVAGRVVHGIEPHGPAAAEAMQILDAVHEGEFSLEAGRELARGVPYDVIVFNDVLEHMVDPGAALRASRDLLAPHSSVIASIPNFRNWRTLNTILREGTFAYADSGVLDRTHLRFFCKRDIIELFIDCGFDVEHIGGIAPLNRKNWQRWKLVSRFLGNDLHIDGAFVQFVVRASLAPPE